MTGEFLAVDAIVEIPRGSRNKYEFDPASGSIRLDRVLFSSVHYPGDYGFIMGTKCGDGDPLDVLILVEEPTFPGCRVRVRPIGVLAHGGRRGRRRENPRRPHGRSSICGGLRSQRSPAPLVVRGRELLRDIQSAGRQGGFNRRVERRQRSLPGIGEAMVWGGTGGQG